MMCVLLAFLWLVLGLALILAPWLNIWDANYFLYAYPALALIVRSPYVRGAVTGLGVLDVLLSFEAIRQWTATGATRS
jgi:hypothetical protein